MNKKVVLVSADGHAAMPEALWPEYVESKYHEFLPQAHEDGERFLEFQSSIIDFSQETLDHMDPDHILRSGRWQGVWDLDIRLAEMDREGIAAEFVIPGDQRVPNLFNTLFRDLPDDVILAGSRAYHRWASDTFGPGKDRLFILGDAAAAGDMEVMLAELDWIADHGFRATQIPGRVVRTDHPPLYDKYFDPFWARCVDHGIAIVMHAGYGTEANQFGLKYQGIIDNMKAAGRTNLLEEFLVHATEFFEMNLKPKQAMWQMMLGGVFDRHPDLKLLMTELRADWVPGILGHLDTVYLKSRDSIPAKRQPSEYWRDNCLAGASFMHKAESVHRHEIGVRSMNVGRDYPHSEGTWPNTAIWLSDLFEGVPEEEVRMMVGGNLIRTLNLDEPYLQSIADRIGPSIEDITGGSRADQQLLEIFDKRGGYLKPLPKTDPAAIDELLLADLQAVGRG